MKKGLLLSILMFLIGTQIAVNAKIIGLTNQELQLVRNNNQFAYNIFSKVRESQLSTLNSQPSTILSPLSITIDLGMLNNGADGVTREEIDAMLGSKDVGGADVVNAFCLKMLTESSRSSSPPSQPARLSRSVHHTAATASRKASA